MAIVDFHGHFLPGIDDGSPNIETSLRMLTDATRQHIDVMVATPHFYADRMHVQSFLERREAAMDRLQSYVEDFELKVICGAEVAFFPYISRAEGLEELCIENTRLMLLEMPFRSWTDRDLHEVEELINRGIIPIFAHLERFCPYQKNLRMLDELTSLGGYGQVNAETFLPIIKRRNALRLFRKAIVCLLGSDCHNASSRPVNLEAGRKILKEKLGIGVLEEMDNLSASLLGISNNKWSN